MLVRIFFFQLKIWNPDASGFFIFNWKIKIRTCPDFRFPMEKLKSGLDDVTNFASPDWYLSMEKYKSGRVRISIFSWKISNPDVSGFSFINEKFQIRTCPDFNFGHVRISIFPLRNFKSGRVRISIPDFRFYPRSAIKNT